VTATTDSSFGGALAVVPIFVGAGAAMWPTILAAITSVAAIVLRPRQLVALVLRRPVAAAAWTAGIALVACVACWLLDAPAGRAAAHADAPGLPRIDWSKIAMDIIARQQSAVAATTPAAPADLGAALVLGHDFARTSYGGGASPMKLKPMWTFHPEDTMFLSTAAVTPTRVYAAGCQNDLGGYTGLLTCLDSQTGKPLWQVTDNGDDPLKPFFSSPAITHDGKFLLIGQGLHEDRNCALLCFDAASGHLLWSDKTSLHVESSPAIRGDFVAVGCGAIEGTDGKAIGDPGHVIGVRISDGHEIFRVPVNDPESSPAIDDDGVVYIGSGFNGCAIVAIRSESDDELAARHLNRVAWRTPVSQPILCAVTLAGDTVIAAGGNGDFVRSRPDAVGVVMALDKHTGKIRWQQSFDDAVLGEIASGDGMLYCPARTGVVTALSLSDGKPIWTTHISGNAPVLAGCALTGSQLYAVANDGCLAILDPKTGTVLERTMLNDAGAAASGLSLSAPQVLNGHVIVGSQSGGLRCLSGTEAP
jgi:outer membrane protein assembly factor BamB